MGQWAEDPSSLFELRRGTQMTEVRRQRSDKGYCYLLFDICVRRKSVQLRAERMGHKIRQHTIIRHSSIFIRPS